MLALLFSLYFSFPLLLSSLSTFLYITSVLNILRSLSLSVPLSPYLSVPLPLYLFPSPSICTPFLAISDTTQTLQPTMTNQSLTHSTLITVVNKLEWMLVPTCGAPHTWRRTSTIDVNIITNNRRK